MFIRIVNKNTRIFLGKMVYKIIFQLNIILIWGNNTAPTDKGLFVLEKITMKMRFIDRWYGKHHIFYN